MTLRLIHLELRRLILRWRFLMAVVLILGLSSYSVRAALRPELEPIHRQGAFSLIAGGWLPLIIPLVAGMTSAGSFAEDRRRRYIPLVLGRGVTRHRYIFAKTIAMGVSSGLAMLLGCLLFFVVALALPPGRTPAIDRAGNRLQAPGPVPHLFEESPVQHDLLAVAMCAVATASLALTGLLVGVVVPNEYVAMAVPFLIVVGGVYAFRDAWEVVSPYLYVDIWRPYMRLLPSQMLRYAAFGYWAIVASLVVGISWILVLHQEVE